MRQQKPGGDECRVWTGRSLDMAFTSSHDTAFPLDTRHSVLSNLHFSNAKIRFQSFFMLITDQPFFFASAISASLNVPTLDFGP